MMDCEVKVESNGYVSIFVGLNLECKQKERESSERRTLMSGGKGTTRVHPARAVKFKW
jgi:hypothetical protein